MAVQKYGNISECEYKWGAGFVYNSVPEVRAGTCTNLRAANIVAYVTAVMLRQGGVNNVSL